MYEPDLQDKQARIFVEDYDALYNSGAVLVALFIGAVSGGIMTALMLWLTHHIS